ncbi:MAG: TetR family transcriptional regulator C-terminal domain-containing protein [Ilumatobacteraceae bacterium]|nr:TetR family transcriptional regulator C-terminal domain-containing protein [Acidimicrobiales bacterium]
MKKQTVEERRNEILEVTCQVVIERGFAGTRISDVAKRLDVSSSLIHYHFDSKEALLAEAFAHYAQNDLAEMEGEIASAPTATAQLDRLIQNMVPEGSDDLEWMLWIDGWGEALRNPMMKKISQQLDEQTTDLLQRVLTQGVETGEFHCGSPEMSAIRLTALVDGLAVQFAAHDGMMDRRTLIDHVRTVAAAEVGLTLADFEGATGLPRPRGSTATPGAATESALRQLLARESDAVVRRDADAWASAWTEHARWTLDTGAVIDGREAIRARWEADAARATWMIQVPAVCVFEVDEHDGTATGRITFEQRSGTAKTTSTRFVTADDTYVRVRGQWHIASRTARAIATL